MYLKLLCFGILSLLLIFVVLSMTVTASPGIESSQYTYGMAIPVGSAQMAIKRLKISGTVEKLTEDKLAIKTKDGRTKEYILDDVAKNQIQSLKLKEGDRVVAHVDQKDQIVDVAKHKKG